MSEIVVQKVANNQGKNVRVCDRCIYDETMPNISFDDHGICNYCHQHDAMVELYGSGRPEGLAQLRGIIAEIKKAGRGQPYDCVVGVSGGTDSSYLLMKAKDWGLRPLAVHYDNTWNNGCSTENLRKVTSALEVDLHTYVVDHDEADDIYRATLLAGVPEWDASSDLAFVQTLRSVAAKFSVKYVLEGHSFTAEGISPVGNNYFDGKYVESIHRQFGRQKLKTFPNLTFGRFLKWMLLYRQVFVRPLWYLAYSKEEARVELAERTGWEYYGGHHLENRAAVFGHTFYLPQRFNIDYRFLSLAAAVRMGVMDRAVALAEYRKPVQPDPEIVDYVKKRLEMSDSDFQAVMEAPLKSWRDYPTYKKRFEMLRPLFAVLVRAGLAPMSFYLKYCFPIEDKK
jgi:hypothetical protein